MTAPVDKTALRVINLGLPKSGTTTLGVALRHAGLRVADWRIRQGQTENRDLLRSFVGDLMYRGYYETGDPLAHLGEFDAVTEMSVASNGFSLWPQMDWPLLAAIRDHYPNTKFLLSHRDAKSLVTSMLGWSNLGRSRLPKQNIPGLPAGFGTTPEALERWVEGHYSFCRHVFRDDPDFMEYDLGDSDPAGKIGEFLGVELPWWGKENVKSSPGAPPASRGMAEAGAVFAGREDRAPAIIPDIGTKRAVYFHGGAHRTGSSSMQLCLQHNAPRLKQAGYALAYPFRDGVETGNLALRLPGPRHDDAPCAKMAEIGRAKFNDLFGERDRLILSEENLPGRMLHFYAGQFFPAAEKRADVLMQAMQARVAHLLFVVRDYAEFFASVHRQRAETHPARPFQQLQEAVLDMSDGWPYLIELFQRHLHPSEITVVDYAHRGESRSLLARLLPDIGIDDLEEPQRQLNRSATDAGLIAIQARFAEDPDLGAAERGAIAQAHRDDAESRGFAAFAPQDRKLLNDRYQRDLDRIGELDGVTLIRG